jgi:hypothetical protein
VFLLAVSAAAPSAFAAQPCGPDTPSVKTLTRSEMPDPNNPGQFIEWAPAPPQPGLSVSDLAGTAAVPTAQQAADATDAIARDQVGVPYMPDDEDDWAQRSDALPDTVSPPYRRS